ncbi:MAG: alginate lyase family protein [Phycisphaerae bacterium]
MAASLSDLRYSDKQAASWGDALRASAEAIVHHRMDLFDLPDLYLGETIDWNYEYKVGRPTSRAPAASIDYRDHHATGDCKFVWEPSRHHQLVVLARAYRVFGDTRYADALIQQLESWIDQCPCGSGMQWRSPLELAIRLINWTYALALMDDAVPLSRERRVAILQSVDQHLRDVTRKYSRYSSANNHLIGEAAGVFVAASYFDGLRRAARWRQESKAILEREILRQTHPDGGTREQATGYHLFVLEFLLISALTARRNEDDFSPDYWRRLEKMFDYLAALAGGSGPLPMLGDADDGRVLDLGGRDNFVASLLCVGAILFNRADFKAFAGRFREPALWLIGPDAAAQFERIKVETPPAALAPVSLPSSGYYILQRGRLDATERISVLMDAGELGFLSIAAHGHADALSVILRVGGTDVLIDPGTYDYFTYPKWRAYFRSTRAHNTIVVDGEDQSRILGPFLWGRRANCYDVCWSPGRGGGLMAASHDGYRSLPDPVSHRRTVELLEDEDTIVIRDELAARGRHEYTMSWHFAEQCVVGPSGKDRTRDGEIDVDFGTGRMSIVLDGRLAVSTARGGESPILGWVSRGYHRKAPAVTVTGRCTAVGDVTLTTRFLLGPRQPRRSSTRGTATRRKTVELTGR